MWGGDSDTYDMRAPLAILINNASGSTLMWRVLAQDWWCGEVMARRTIHWRSSAVRS